MGLKQNAVVRRVVEAGEAKVGKLAGQLLSDDRFVGAIQTLVSRTLSAKGVLDKSLRAALATMNLPSSADVEKLGEKLDDVDRLLTELEGRLSQLESHLEAEPQRSPKKKAGGASA